MRSNIAEIQQAILELPESNFVRLRNWFNELDWAEWDREIETDSGLGKLDFLVSSHPESRVLGDWVARGRPEKLQ